MTFSSSFFLSFCIRMNEMLYYLRWCLPCMKQQAGDLLKQIGEVNQDFSKLE